MMIRVAALALVMPAALATWLLWPSAPADEPLALPALACERGTLTGHVTYVRDGDTIEFGGMAIRLQGLAAPEWNEPSGKETRDALLELVHGRTVRCELDGSRTYDRCAGVCFLDGEDIAVEMVRRGLARDCPRFSGGRYAVIEHGLRRRARGSERATGCRGTAGPGRAAAAPGE